MRAPPILEQGGVSTGACSRWRLRRVPRYSGGRSNSILSWRCLFSAWAKVGRSNAVSVAGPNGGCWIAEKELGACGEIQPI